MNGNHGHVVPNPNGTRARCGGPGLCPVCDAELAQYIKEHGAPPSGFAPPPKPAPPPMDQVPWGKQMQMAPLSVLGGRARRWAMSYYDEGVHVFPRLLTDAEKALIEQVRDALGGFVATSPEFTEMQDG